LVVQNLHLTVFEVILIKHLQDNTKGKYRNFTNICFKHNKVRGIAEFILKLLYKQ